MSNELSLITSGHIRSSGDNSAEQQSSLRKQVEAEKHAKINELLAPYRSKRNDLQRRRDELASGLEEVDRDLNELDGVISQVEASVGLHPSSTRKKKHTAKKSSGGSKPPVSEEWVIQKLREERLSLNQLMVAAKEDGFKGSSAKRILTKLQDANLVRCNDGSHYEVV